MKRMTIQEASAELLDEPAGYSTNIPLLMKDRMTGIPEHGNQTEYVGVLVKEETGPDSRKRKLVVDARIPLLVYAIGEWK